MHKITLLLILLLPIQAFAAWEIQPECKTLTPENLGKRKLSPQNSKDWKFLKCQAENGDRFEQYYIGIALLDRNRHGPADNKLNEGLYWLTKAAERGEHNAQNHLARIYFEGIKGFLEKDINRAYQWRYLMMNNKEFPNYPDSALIEIKEAVPIEKRAELEKEAYQLLEQKE